MHRREKCLRIILKANFITQGTGDLTASAVERWANKKPYYEGDLNYVVNPHNIHLFNRPLDARIALCRRIGGNHCMLPSEPCAPAIFRPTFKHTPSFFPERFQSIQRCYRQETNSTF